MPTFELSYSYIIEADDFTTVDAETEEEAREIVLAEFAFYEGLEIYNVEEI